MKKEKKSRNRLSFSLRTPWWIIHFDGFAYDGFSRYHVAGSYAGIVDPQRISNPRFHKNLLHYDKHGRLFSKTTRSFFGEPNHYDLNNRCLGYSRRQSAFRTNHYDRRGNLVGHTKHFLGFILVHHTIS